MTLYPQLVVGNAASLSLEVLNLSSCNLTEIPPDIKTLHNLTTLNLSNNLSLNNLPNELGNLTKLTQVRYLNIITYLERVYPNLRAKGVKKMLEASISRYSQNNTPAPLPLAGFVETYLRLKVDGLHLAFQDMPPQQGL